MERLSATQRETDVGHISTLERWGRLRELIEDLRAVGSVEETVQVLRFSARVIAGADGITIVRREGEFVHYVAEDAVSPLWTGRRFPIESCVSGIAMLSRKPVIIPDISGDPRVPHYAYESTFVKSMAMFPVGIDQPRMAIGSYWRRRGDLEPETTKLLATMARSAGAVLDNLEAVHFVSLQETRLRVVAG
jgi:GAF domain-containing protein